MVIAVWLSICILPVKGCRDLSKIQKLDPEEVEKLISEKVKVCIHGPANEDQAPWVDRRIHNVTPCPDHTHLRIYFDHYFFVAIPFTSEVVKKKNEWIAYDEESKLFYAIRSEVIRYD